MLNLVALSKQTAAQQRPAICADYWLENSAGGFSDITSGNEHNPMQTASSYKWSGN